MKKYQKKAILGLILVSLMVQCFLLNEASASLIGIWGVTEDSARTYDYYEIYLGSVNGTKTYPRRAYQVGSIFDLDGNNYTELLMQITTTSQYGLPQVSTLVLDDSNLVLWTDANLRPTTANFYTFSPLYPINGSASANVGFNWTRSMINYDKVIAGWNMTIINNTATINQSTSGVDMGANYNQTILIQWDVSTGWLISFNYTRVYNETLGYTVNYQTVVFVEPGGGGFNLDIGLLISIIAIAVGGVAIAIALLSYKKRR